MGLNGLGQGYVETSSDFFGANVKVTFNFSYDMGVLNILGLILSFVLLLVFVSQELDIKNDFLSQYKDNILIISLITILLAGILYVILFIIGIGNISYNIMGFTVTIPLSDLRNNSNNTANSASIYYGGLWVGFYLSLISSIWLFIKMFKATTRRSRRVILLR